MDGSVAIHIMNIQSPATESFRDAGTLSSPITNYIFNQKDNRL